MSELVQNEICRVNIRWRLMASGSALAISAYLGTAINAAAEEENRPAVWIELGGQFDRLEIGEEAYSPALMADRPSIFSSASRFQKSPPNSFDLLGKLAFQPDGSDWSFVAAVQFGRSTSDKRVHQQTYPRTFEIVTNGGYQFNKYPLAARFADTEARKTEQHVIADFMAGRDVGIGLFGGREATSTIGLGIRFAQFVSKSNVALKSNPDWHFNTSSYNGIAYVTGQPYHSNRANFSAERSFRGVGPAVSWKSSVPFAGNEQSEEMAIDWGLNAALLFGRQKARTHHEATGLYQPGGFFYPAPVQQVYHDGPVDSVRTKSVTVPNVGGFAALSFKYANAAVSLGYRANFFFGAMDGGIDSRKTYDRNFYGPYATISIGLGG